jgi:hypothetical protein
MNNNQENKIILDLVGSDPELFLRNKKTKEFVSAIGLIPGSKEYPWQIESLPEGNCLQTDNVMVEFTLPPTKKANELFKSIQNCINFTNNIIPSDLECVIESSAILSKEYLNNKQAQTFGCSPDFNAWLDGNSNVSPSAKDSNLRTAGGHVSISYNHNGDLLLLMNLVKALDITLSLPSILLDSDKRRKEMYGKAGAFRITQFGLEYRSLSNFWIKELHLVEFVFNGINKAIELVNEGRIDNLTDEEQLQIQLAINTSDESLAHELIYKYKIDKVLLMSSIDLD